MIEIKIKFLILTAMINSSVMTSCIPKNCKELSQKRRHIPTDLILKCLLEKDSHLRFNSTSAIGQSNNKSCNDHSVKINIIYFVIRPKDEGSIVLGKEMIDLSDIIKHVMSLNFEYIYFELQMFKGFQLNLFDNPTIDLEKSYSSIYFRSKIAFFIRYSLFDFYSVKERRIKSCQDLINSKKSTNPRSIFQFLNKLNDKRLELHLAESKNQICPLAFKNFIINEFVLYGENSFYSKKLLSFSNETFKDLNSVIQNLLIEINNVELDTNLLHPDVFKQLRSINFMGKVKKIHPEIFANLDKVIVILLKNDYLRSLMHKSGIEWIKNINRDVKCNLSNRNELNYYFSREKFKIIYIDCVTKLISAPLDEIFPDEDFCLYKDFPINQLVVIIQNCRDRNELNTLIRDLTCTFIWITRSYKQLVNISYEYRYIIASSLMRYFLKIPDYDSISKCNFEAKLDLCNKSKFEAKQISTFFELGQSMLMTQTVFNILSYVLSIFGIVTNVLIIITISIKSNETNFKGRKQYEYLRLMSFYNCLILLIHLISWLNQCIYPFQVFCPLIRKSIFMQYFKIVVEEVLMTAFKFMNNFMYIGFAFNRIALIGQDHNKLVKFMSDLGVKKYFFFSLSISIGLSVIKFFEYDINPGIPFLSYPISYDYQSTILKTSPSVLVPFIFNFVSDITNYFILLLVNLAIDIGMIVNLRQTLNEKLEKSKECFTKAQLEKRKSENEMVIENTKSMIICNTSINLLLKLPSSLYSFMFMYFNIYRFNPKSSGSITLAFARFHFLVCIDASFCDMLLQLADFCYFLCISIQLFFYRRYDKNFSQSFNNMLRKKKS